MRRCLLALCLLLLAAGTAVAEKPLADPALETRARALFEELRCVVCQNESIASSHAGIAADMRTLVREKLADGESEDEIKAFLVARYGNYVLLKPPFEPMTWLLWLGPLLILGAGAGVLLLRLRRPSPLPAERSALSAEERERLRILLQEEP